MLLSHTKVMYKIHLLLMLVVDNSELNPAQTFIPETVL